MHTSMGWSTDVRPPGIAARSVFKDFADALTSSVTCTRNMSQISIDRLACRAPGRVFQTRRSQSFVPSLSIYPFGCACTMTPDGNLAPFGSVFRLKMTTCFSLMPFAMHERTTVKWVLSWPVVRTNSFSANRVDRSVACQTSWAFHPCCLFGRGRRHVVCDGQSPCGRTRLYSLGWLGASASSLCAGEGTGHTNS